MPRALFPPPPRKPRPVPKTARALPLKSAPAGRASSPALVRLSEMTAGRAARLDRRELTEGEACLLAAMGLTLGCRLVVRSSGDPCIVEVRSTRIGLARSVASRLLVTDESGLAEPER